jgi:hypothetical protein
MVWFVRKETVIGVQILSFKLRVFRNVIAALPILGHSLSTAKP